MKQSRLRSRPKDIDPEEKALWDEAAERWWNAVTRKARCVVCHGKTDLQAHHVIPKELLKRLYPLGAMTWTTAGIWVPADWMGALDEGHRTLREIVWDRRNGLPVCRRDHERHTTAYRRIPRYLIPAKTWQFARELAPSKSGGDLTYILESDQYPVA